MDKDNFAQPAVANYTTGYSSPSSPSSPGQLRGVAIAGAIVLAILLLWLSIGRGSYLPHTLRLHPHTEQWSAACDGAPIPC